MIHMDDMTNEMQAKAFAKNRQIEIYFTEVSEALINGGFVLEDKRYKYISEIRSKERYDLIVEFDKKEGIVTSRIVDSSLLGHFYSLEKCIFAIELFTSKDLLEQLEKWFMTHYYNLLRGQ